MELLKNEVQRLDLQEKVVHISRVAKVVKGGRNFRFSALVVVGDGNGHVGVGIGKALEVPESIQKAVQNAKKHMIEVPIVNTTIPHKIVGVAGTGRVLKSLFVREYLLFCLTSNPSIMFEGIMHL